MTTKHKNDNPILVTGAAGAVGGIGLPEQDVAADQIIAGTKQIIARAHARCANTYGATLTPYEGTIFHGYASPRGGFKRRCNPHPDCLAAT